MQVQSVFKHLEEVYAVMMDMFEEPYIECTVSSHSQQMERESTQEFSYCAGVKHGENVQKGWRLENEMAIVREGTRDRKKLPVVRPFQIEHTFWPGLSWVGFEPVILCL